MEIREGQPAIAANPVRRVTAFELGMDFEREWVWYLGHLGSRQLSFGGTWPTTGGGY
jgi:hypothetical protein